MNAQGTTKKGAAYSHPPKFDNVIFCRLLKSLYLCIAFEKKHQALSRGVMVTHLILVQTFKVRVLTGQQDSQFRHINFRISVTSIGILRFFLL